jgi:hypothetical protein
MTTETTYTLDQLNEKIAEFLELQTDITLTERFFTIRGFDNFSKWLTSEPDFVGWVGFDCAGDCYFHTNPTQNHIKKFNMRKVIYAPKDKSTDY